MKNKNIIPFEIIEKKIYFIRGKKIMLDKDLAELYEVETKVLNQAIKRNIDRFPEDFMFQLTKNEYLNLRSQIVTSSWGGRRYPPYAFTEQGIAMLSSVLKSERANTIDNGQLTMDNYEENTKAIDNGQLTMDNYNTNKTEPLNSSLLTPNPEPRTIKNMEEKNDKQLQVVFETLKKMLMIQEDKKKRKIGFQPNKKSKNKEKGEGNE